MDYDSYEFTRRFLYIKDMQMPLMIRKVTDVLY